MLEILKVVGQGGFPVLFALMLIGIFWLVKAFGPQVLVAWYKRIESEDARNVAIVAALGRLEAKLDAVLKQSELAEDVAEIKGALGTGGHAAVSSDDAARALERKKR